MLLVQYNSYLLETEACLFAYSDGFISTEHFQPVAKLRANKIGTLHGRLIVGTAEKIPPSELLDTTGAGDAFIGAVLYGICQIVNTQFISSCYYTPL